MNYRIGDVTYPQTKNPCLIPHIVNDVGVWGSGVVIAISKRWTEPEYKYRKAFIDRNLSLGNVQFTRINSPFAHYKDEVKPDIHVANMVAQKGYGRGLYYKKCDYWIPPIRYSSLEETMYQVAEYCLEKNLEIHAPKFGSDRAGGEWSIIESLIEKIWENNGISVDIYDYQE